MGVPLEFQREPENKTLIFEDPTVPKIKKINSILAIRVSDIFSFDIFLHSSFKNHF